MYTLLMVMYSGRGFNYAQEILRRFPYGTVSKGGVRFRGLKKLKLNRSVIRQTIR